jgi:hypothetical protein
MDTAKRSSNVQYKNQGPSCAQNMEAARAFRCPQGYRETVSSPQANEREAEPEQLLTRNNVLWVIKLGRVKTWP